MSAQGIALGLRRTIPKALKGRNKQSIPNGPFIKLKDDGDSITWLLQRVRERPGLAGHSLPVVVMGSVPHIDRREGLSPGDPN